MADSVYLPHPMTVVSRGLEPEMVFKSSADANIQHLLSQIRDTKSLHRLIIDKINLTQIAGSGMSESDLLEEIKGRLAE